MADVRIKVVIDGQESVQTIDELNKSLDQFKKNTENLDDGSEEFDQFNKSIEELQSTLEKGLNLDLDSEQLNAKLSEVSTDLTNLTGQKFDIKVDVPENTVKSYAALRKEAQLLANELENLDPGSDKYQEVSARLQDVSIQAANTKDRIEDFNESIKTRTGSPLEQFKNSLDLTREGILNLDFEKAKAGFSGIGNSVKGLLPPLNSLKGAIIATGIGALVVAVGLLIANFDELKEAIFGVSDADKANLKLAEDRVKREQDKLDAISSQENSLRLQGKSEKEILQLKINQTEELIAAQEAQIITQQNITKSQIETAKRNRGILEGILGFINIPLRITLEAIDRAVKFFDKDAPSLVEGFDDLISKGLDKAGIFDVKQIEEDAKIAEDESQKALLKLKNQRDGFILSVNKSEQDARNKNLQEQDKYNQELQKLNEKYLLTEEERIRKKYDEELEKIKGVSEEEKKLRDAIISRREEELNALTSSVADKAAKDAIELRKLRTQNLEELRQLELESLQLETDIKLRNTKLTEDEKNIIIEDAAKKRLDINKNFLDKETNAVIEATNEQSEDIKKEREKILRDVDSGFGLLGSLDDLEASFKKELELATNQYNSLKKINDDIINDVNTTEQEKEDARKRNKKLEEDYQEKQNQILQEGADTREEILKAEFLKRVEQVEQALSIVTSVSDTQLDSERSRIEQSAALLDQDYEKRRAYIENNIKDETQREAALAQLDNEFNTRRNQLDKAQIELQKKQIKRERNFALAQIALNAAKAFSDTTAASIKSDPVSFALSIAANLAVVIATIAKARNALKEADASIGAIGAGGGGGNVSLPSGPSGTGGGAQQFSPTGFQPTGVNPAQFGSGGGQNQPTQPQQFVSVVEIERVRNSVNVIETQNTISGG